MQIFYIWVRQYKNFQNAGFNFSSREKFSYNEKLNELRLVKSIDLPRTFYGPDIENVTGIFGKNGSGKSNLLELVCNVLSDENYVDSEFIVVFQVGFNLHYYHNFDAIAAPTVDRRLKFQDSFSFRPYCNVLFFSNVFDERRPDFPPSVIDVSINKIQSTRVLFGRKKEPSSFIKQMDFINSGHYRSLGLEIPTQIQIACKVWSASRFTYLRYGDSNGNVYKLIGKIGSEYLKKLPRIDGGKAVGYTLAFTLFYDVITTIMNHEADTKNSTLLRATHNLVNIIAKEDIEQFPMAFFHFVARYRGKIFNLLKTERRITNMKEEATLNRKIKLIKRLLKGKNYIPFRIAKEGTKNQTTQYVTLPYGSSDTQNFFREFLICFGSSNQFTVSWNGISSGQKAFLNLFASIHFSAKLVKRKSLIVCIDEGDLYLHPAWQLDFLDKILTTLPKLFKGNIQLILTSHSPFLLSDLPNTSVIILNNDSALDGYLLKKKTFAGNIYNLYEEPFFLEKKRRSTFANSKISAAVKSIKSKKAPSKKAIQTFESTVDLIGDEVLSFYLKKMIKYDPNI